MDEPCGSKLGNGIVGILAESCNMWERRVPLTPFHCARLLHGGSCKAGPGVQRIVVQPSTKRVHHDAQYEEVGCEISEDLSECGLILGIKQPKLEMILPRRAYAFFSHTHKAQKENMPLLDKILEEKVSLYDYELIVGENGKRLLAFGKFAGRAGLVDLLHGLGMRYLNLGYSTPFLSLGASYMYSSLAAAKAAVITVGEEIAANGLPPGISPLIFVFTGSGNVSQGAQEIFKLLPHTFVEAGELPKLVGTSARGCSLHSSSSKRAFQVYGCVVTCQDMVKQKNSGKIFDKVEYYAHPEDYDPVFHDRIAPYASVIVNCMYWEKRFPRLLTTTQLQELKKKGCPLVAISDITCDIGGSIEFINQTTSIERPFFRYDPCTGSYYNDMFGDGIICLAVDILPTEFPKEASKYFGDTLSQFIGHLASATSLIELPSHLKRACITHNGALTSLYEYIPRMRGSSLINASSNGVHSGTRKYSTTVSLHGHLFDQFLINEALDIIEAAGGSFHLLKCEVGQTSDSMSYSELQVEADDAAILNQIIDSLNSNVKSNRKKRIHHEKNMLFTLVVGKANESLDQVKDGTNARPAILILGAGRVCRPAAEFIALAGIGTPEIDSEFCGFQVIVASLYIKDAEETIEGIPNSAAIQLDANDYESLSRCISQVDVVISLLPPSFHIDIANACIEHKKDLVTASYVSESMSALDGKAKKAGVTILCEMGLDPGIDHMIAMKMISQAHLMKGKIRSFSSYCGGLPSPSAANNPLAYKFSWNPSGAIRAGQNSAKYLSCGEVTYVDGKELYDSATRFRIPDLPAFALEYLPNRNSLVYGDLYGIAKEASTIFRATLRYEGYGEIMGTLAKLGFFESEIHPLLKEDHKPTFRDFLKCLLRNKNSDIDGSVNSEIFLKSDNKMTDRLMYLGCCKEKSTAEKTVKTIKFLGLHEIEKIPSTCFSAFDVICIRMEERLAYSNSEQDMVLLHHEIEIEFPDERPMECHKATLLEFGKTANGKSTSAMALTVGVPAAIGALLLVQDKIKEKGVIRPFGAEVYLPALEMLKTYGVKISEKVEQC